MGLSFSAQTLGCWHGGSCCEVPWTGCWQFRLLQGCPCNLCLCFPGRVCSVVYRHGNGISMVKLPQAWLQTAWALIWAHGWLLGCGIVGVQVVLTQMRFGEMRGGILERWITHKTCLVSWSTCLTCSQSCQCWNGRLQWTGLPSHCQPHGRAKEQCEHQLLFRISPLTAGNWTALPGTPRLT